MSQKCTHFVKWNILFSLKFYWYSDASKLNFKNIFFYLFGHTVKAGRCLFRWVSTIRIQFHFISSLYSIFSLWLQFLFANKGGRHSCACWKHWKVRQMLVSALNHLVILRFCISKELKLFVPDIINSLFLNLFNGPKKSLMLKN